MDEKFTPDVTIEEPAPLVDEALAATDRKIEGQEAFNALRAEIAGLKESAREAATGAGRLAMEDFRERVRSQPLSAALAIGFLAFVYGATR